MEVTLIPFRAPLAAPLTLAGRTYTEREGVLLRLEQNGCVGWGEAAPLPGFSPDTLAEARAALASLAPTLFADALAVFQPSAPLVFPKQPPAAHAAVESALLDLHAQHRGTTMARLLDPDAAEIVQVNGLITMETPDDAATEARRLYRQGYQAVKLKVGRRPVQDDVARVRAVADALGPTVALRLDANRAWSLVEVRTFAEGINGIALAYVEEPVARAADLPDAARLLPVALDETLVGSTPDMLRAHPYARAVVLKPMLLGGVLTAWRWALAARERGMEAVVSAAFETGVGMRANVALAAALGGTPPAGLDTYRRIARDVLPNRLPLDGPEIEVAPVLASLPADLPDA